MPFEKEKTGFFRFFEILFVNLQFNLKCGNTNQSI